MLVRESSSSRSLILRFIDSSSIEVVLAVELGVIALEATDLESHMGAGAMFTDDIFGTSVSYRQVAFLDLTQLLHGVARLQRSLRFRHRVHELWQYVSIH